ncbi:MAG: phosphotransferase [Actinomycetia bacterium]|nr:phosphotransferase [Actinomycetes bacterium]MCP5034243.1 phosphotransferase [Actinomycetes bacterium]
MDDTLADLLAAIRTEANDSSLQWARPPTVLSGGFWAQMWQVELTGATADLDGPLVARVMPDADVAAHETAVQAYLAETGYPAPRVRLAGAPGPDMDRAWMLMDLVSGQPLLADMSGVRTLVGLPRLARSLPDRLAAHAATLHAIDPGNVPKGTSPEASLEEFTDQARRLGRDDLAEVAIWLSQHRPPGGRSVVCHGDLHPFNILTGPSGDTVLDWSSARVTDPAYDLAYTTILLSHPPLAAPGFLAPAIVVAGRALARRFRRTYDRTASMPVDPDQLDWFISFQSLRVLLDVAHWTVNDELDQHPGHPFFVLAPPLTSQLATTTGIEIAPA